MAPPNVLMVGTGEYATGSVGGGMSGSDRKSALYIEPFSTYDEEGKNISAVYNNLDTGFTSFPSDTVTRDREACKAAIDALSPCGAVTMITPDTMQYPIALYAIHRGMHLRVTKPAVKLLAHHESLLAESRKHNVFVFIEHHKCFDLADVDTLKAWAGKDDDVSYYLNGHYVDICESMVPDWRPVRVTANGSRGIAQELGCAAGTEYTISLLVNWQNRNEPDRVATRVYTTSWTAPQQAGVHSNQYFRYLASGGEIRVDQVKRGHDVASITEGQLVWYNPFYMEHAPDEEGNSNGQSGHSCISFEKFVDAVTVFKDRKVTLEGLDARGLPTLKNTIVTTTSLEAGRRSLEEGKGIEIVESAEEWRLR